MSCRSVDARWYMQCMMFVAYNYRHCSFDSCESLHYLVGEMEKKSQQLKERAGEIVRCLKVH